MSTESEIKAAQAALAAALQVAAKARAELNWAEHRVLLAREALRKCSQGYR